LIAALALAWWRARAAYWRDNFRTVEAPERELRLQLTEDVILMGRLDWVVERIADGRKFVVNWKTTSDASARWLKDFATDSQILTEAYAAEQALGLEISGVIIEGLVKGRRYTPQGEGKQPYQVTPLLYAYKRPANPPLEPTADYRHEYTRQKGYVRTAIWEDPDLGATEIERLANWVQWLPLEVVEAQIATPEPILRAPDRVQHKIVQIIGIEQRVAEGAEEVNRHTHPFDAEGLDFHFPQNERACNWSFGRGCPFYDICWMPDVGADPIGSGKFMARDPHHPEMQDE